jgi:hypothetical protein
MDRIADVLMEIFNVSIWWFSHGCLCGRPKILFDGWQQHYNIVFEYNYQCKLLINIKRYLQKVNFTRGVGISTKSFMSRYPRRWNDVLCPSFVGFLSDDISIPSIFQKSSFYLYDLSSNMKVLVFTHNDTTSHFLLRLFYDKVW